MKAKCFVIGMLVLLAMATCTRPKATLVETRFIASPQLSAIDSLMWQRPDSALACLLPYFDTCCRDAKFCVSTATAYNRHYAHLLLSELLYKNDYAQTNRTELLQAMAYFDSLVREAPPLKGGRGDVPLKGVPERAGDSKHKPNPNDNLVFLTARAHYINGVGYYEHDSVVEACGEYLKVLEVMEGHFEEKDLVGHKAQFMALTYTRLTDIFTYFYLHEPAIYFAQCSLPYYRKQGSSSWNLSWVLNKIGSHYDMMNVLDSAEYYYQNAATSLQDTNTLMFRDIVAHQAYLEFKKDSLQADVTIQQLEKLLLKSENNLERVIRCASIGEVFYREKQFDSAWYYLNMVYNETLNINVKKQTAEWLVEICKVQGRGGDILEYADFLVPFANQEENNSGRKSRLTELYNAFRQLKWDQQHHKETEKHKKQVLLVLGGLFIAMMVVIIFYRKNKRSKQKLEVQMEAERHAHKMQQAALAGRLKKSNESLRDVSQQLEKNVFPHNAVSGKMETQVNFSAFVESPVCDHILKIVEERNFKPKVDYLIYKDYALDKKQLMDLVKAADSHLGQYTERIRKKHPALTNDDMKYCCLYLLGLNEADISALMQRAYTTVCERNRKIKRIIGTENDLPMALKELI